MSLIIYLIAFLEWFTTLSVEIVWIRQFAPVLWINSISTSIVLGVILLALSYWYYKWWILSLDVDKIKKRLFLNLSFASIYYFLITFVFSTYILETMLGLSNSYFLSILLTSVILFFVPVFLASQTLPLLSEILKWSHAWEKVWKLLFYSTVWSFVWSIWTSIVFFPLLWVFKTWLLSALFLSVCVLLISIFFIKKEVNIFLWFFMFIFFLYFIIFYNPIVSSIYSFANAHHNIDIYDIEHKRIFSIDWWYSSGIDLSNKTSFFWYINEVQDRFLELKPKNILVIWAAWFTFPDYVSRYDFVENIDVVDIDSSLKDISEKFFLEKELSSKINFYPTTARYFINNTEDKKYDLILVDAYSWKSPPSQVLTYEFFDKLNSIWKNIYLNIILDKKLNTDFSTKLLSTVSKAFSESYYKDVNDSSSYLTNLVITNVDNESYTKNTFNLWSIYTDDKNSIELDIFTMRKNNYLYKKI